MTFQECILLSEFCMPKNTTISDTESAILFLFPVTQQVQISSSLSVLGTSPNSPCSCKHLLTFVTTVVAYDGFGGRSLIGTFEISIFSQGTLFTSSLIKLSNSFSVNAPPLIAASGARKFWLSLSTLLPSPDEGAMACPFRSCGISCLALSSVWQTCTTAMACQASQRWQCFAVTYRPPPGGIFALQALPRRSPLHTEQQEASSFSIVY